VPLLIESGVSPLESALALVAAVTALVALAIAPLLLPLAIGLVASELIVSVHRAQLSVWSIPFFAVGLLLVYEAGELRHRLPAAAMIERRSLRALARRLALTAALGLLASVVVIATANVSSRGGVAAAVVGGLAALGTALLVTKASR
jgi:hypothetical protein